MNPLPRKHPHELVDELSEDQVEAADRYLRSLRNQDDPIIRAMRAAPVDDEALGHEDRKGIDDGRRDIAAGRGIPEDKFAASTNYDMAPDQDPTRRNRRRLSERGLVRFEVLGRDCDRELIRTLAGRLAEEGPHADRLRTIISKEIGSRTPRKGGILRALRSSPLGGANITAKRSPDDNREIDL